MTLHLLLKPLALFLLLLALPPVSADINPQERRAKWHATFKAAQPVGREIVTIDPQSVLNEAALQVGDVLLSVNDEVIRDGDQWWDIIYGLRAATETKLTYRRAQQVHSVSVVFEPVPLEQYDSLRTEYGFVTSDYNIRQRTIVTLPESEALLPAIFVVGGLSCSSMEYTPGRQSNFIRSLRYLVEHSDMMVMRVEKPGVGDSEGRCSQTDFLTELNGYEVALKTLLADARVDREKVIVYGSSMGSALAPYLANKYQLNGVISDGTFYRSWFEHMLEIERRILTMKGDDQATVNDKINRAYIPLYYGMLIEKKSYQQVIAQSPLLAEHNYHSPAHMYGRPVSFYHQMQDFNFAGEWAKLDAPARIRWGRNDWIMSEYDIDMLAQVLAAKGHNDYEVLKVPGLDHWDTLHDSALNSFQGKPGQWNEALPQQLVDWARYMQD
ncbi:site-2 protease family protein [Planctobacterium marinum]|uniref:site-2 protease family protein n=1 Tax=Planctobacterium marinum TaxID=1631968 RepID=UPI001E54AAE7|nr:site-2 protease family protein [Planctobacterium marinum]MCC2607097.1 hypothetical protein [Planctobacterium marinum]